MTDLTYDHVTLRIPGADHLLINPYGLFYREITATSLTRIDVEGASRGSRTPTTAGRGGCPRFDSRGVPIARASAALSRA